MSINRPRVVLPRITVLALLLLVGQHVVSVQAATDLSGAEAPDFVLKSVSGANYRLSEYRGDVVVVSFSANWCGDCRALLSELNEWHRTYQGAGLKLLAISLDRRVDDASDTASGLGLEYPVLHDAELEVGRAYDVGNMPVSVLIDRDGIVRHVEEGFRRSEAQAFLDRVRDLLRE
ncbi:MAG TPA: TlpA disulfide reductase family protein [Gammaproteobacteria bacterium]|nr:TlpA disulfide reductase family protein [Gammaproteobacteria bacterium]